MSFPSCSISECENSELEDGTTCSQLTSTVTAHYSGDATEEQQQALFDSLTNTLQDQIASGRFSEVADVHYVDIEATERGEGSGSQGEGQFGSSAKSSGGGLPIGGIAGGLVAVVALVAAGCFVYVKKPFADSNCGDCGPAAIGTGDNSHVVQVLSDDGDLNARAY